MADIVHQLQTLTGNTLGEVFRMLNIIIKNNGDSIKSNLSIIFSSLDSNDYFQKLVKIRLIDQYKYHEEVLRILKSDDSFSISHVLQQCLWFFQTCSTSPEVLVNSVFPCMSCSTRNKVIKKYSKYLKDKNTADKIFVLLKARYGLSVALFLLPACSEVFIKGVLEKSSIKIPVFILNSVFDLYPMIVINYISHLLDCKEKKKRVIRNLDLRIYEGLVLHIVSRDPVKYFSLLVKYNKINYYPLKLGKRSTRHLIMSDFDSFKNDFKIYSDIIDWKKVGARLQVEQLVDLQARLLPQTPADFIQCFKNSSDFIVILSHIKSDKAVQKTLINFKNVYGKEIVAYLDRFNLQQVAKLPPNLSEAWAEKRLPETEDHRLRAEYTKLLPVDKAIPQLKKLIQIETDSGVRGFMVECLCNKVKESNDPSLVGPLFEYILKRHRNEKAYIKEHAFSVLEDFPKVMELPEEAWKLVEELYNLMIANKEGDFYKIVIVICKQIEWRLMKGLSAQEYLEKVIKHRTFYYDFGIGERSPFEKFCLCWFINWHEKNNAKSDQRNIDLNSLFSRISKFNSKHPDEKIPIPEWLIEEIKLMFADEKTYHYTKANILEDVRKNDDLVGSFYEQIFPKYVDNSILMHYLRSKPIVLKDSSVVDKLLTLSLHSYRLFLMKVRLHSPFGIPQFFSKHCISTLKTSIKRDEDGEEEPGVPPSSVKRNAIYVLSLVLPVNEYLQVISGYYPKDKAVQDFSVAANENFEIQQEIALCFKEINNPSHVLDSLMKFTCGDFLKFVVGSVNSVMCRSPEIKILPLLNTRIDGPVSVKKHFIRVYFKIAPIQNTLELLLNLFKNEKNVTVRLLLLKSALKFFLSEPCEETFSVLRAVVEQLNESDETALESLFSNKEVEKVPDSFLANYLLLLWDVASTKKEKLVEKRRDDVISMISPSVLRVISEEFVDTLISQVLGKGFNLDLESDFVINYLIFSKDFHQFDKRLSIVMDTLKPSLAQWDLPDFNIRNVFLVKKTLSIFIDRLITECFKMHVEKDIEGPLLPPNELLRLFKTSLLLVIKEDDILKEAVLLDLAMFFLGTPFSEKGMSKLLNFVEPLANNIITHYGNDAIGLITSGVSYVGGLWASGHSIDIEKELLSFAELLIANDSINCKLIGIKLLPKNVKNENKSKYKALVNSILQIAKSLRTTKIVINEFLVNLTAEDGEEDNLDDEFEESVEQLDISEGASEEL